MNKLLIIVFSLLCAVLMFSAGQSVLHFSSRVYLSSLAIQVFSIIQIFNQRSIPFSLKKIFYLFSLFFFGISPVLQFYHRTALFGAREITENEYFYFNLLIFFILILFQLLYTQFQKLRLTKNDMRISRIFSIHGKPDIKQVLTLIAFSLLSFFLVFKANSFSFFSLLIRGGEMKELSSNSSTTTLIIFRFFQPISMMCLLYYISSKSKNFLVYFILTLLTLLTCFPLSMARFAAAAMYIPLMLLIFPFFKKKNVFSLVFILGLLVVFPFLNNFRYFGSSEFKYGFNFEMFTEGHFDSYQNFALIVFDNIITGGRQLLGVFFFWVPRSIWPAKPIGSGAFIADKMGFFFDNVSCNYFAEGYINFGFFGILLFIFLLAFFTAKMDKLYWKVISNDKNNFFKVIYFVLLGMLFFMLRGDLMSSFAYTVGFILAILIVNKIGSLKVK
ncbi:O-antigen polymerase [Proteiniphilum saccharofermentans]|nr:O-antigen polymerase [Proteiniphilum saccharofermentans]